MTGRASSTRMCFQLKVRPDRIDEYVAWHASVWPEMLDALHETGWRNYSLFIRPDGLVTGYWESDSPKESQAAMERTAVNARWQAEMARFFDEQESPYIELAEVFNLADQRGAP